MDRSFWETRIKGLWLLPWIRSHRLVKGVIVMADSFRIVNGPSKFELVISLFEGNPTPRHTATFEIEAVGGVQFKVAIYCISQEDGSGESWNFEGYLTNGPSKGRGRVKGLIYRGLFPITIIHCPAKRSSNWTVN